MTLSSKKSILKGAVRIPPSKSYTHRALIAASLSDGNSKLDNLLLSSDTLATVDACIAFGSQIKITGNSANVSGSSSIKLPQNIINANNSGTTIRIMTALSSLCPDGYVVLTGDESLRNRPMEPLLDALNQLGVMCWSTRLNGTPPIIVKGGGLNGGSVEIPGNISSQFITAILIASTKSKKDVKLAVTGMLVSRPYIDSTIHILDLFGCNVISNNDQFIIPSNQSFTPTNFTVPGDFSSASFIMAAAAITNGTVKIEGLDFNMPQADMRMIDILLELGVGVEINKLEGSVTINGVDSLGSGDFNLSDSPDLLPAVATLASKTSGEISIHGVRHARFKETDRISALANEFKKAGIIVVESDDGLRLSPPSNLKPFKADSHLDHRIFMALSVLGLVSDSKCIISGNETISVSYPSFISDIQSLGGSFEVIN